MRAAEDTLYRRAFHSLPDAITVSRIDDGIIEDANQGFLDLTGYTRTEVVGRSASDLGIYADPSSRARLVRQVLRGGRVADFAVSVRTRDGQRKGVSLSAAIVPADGDVRLFAIGRLERAESSRIAVGERDVVNVSSD